MASKACCTIPPVISDTDSYKVQGTYTTLDGMRTYVTGPSSSKTGVLVIYDIFGLDFNQTLQGTDIIASSGSLVVVPDLFRGAPMDIKNYPPDTPEKEAALGAFFAGPAAPPSKVAAIKELFPKLQEKFPGVEKWALVGYCWGGKIVTLLSREGSLFAAAAQIHPAMLDPEDAKKLTIPHFCLATKDEGAKVVEEFKKNVEENEKTKGNSTVLYWEGTFHGFMAARANLKDKENLEYYEKGYKKLVHYLKEVL